MYSGAGLRKMQSNDAVVRVAEDEGTNYAMPDNAPRCVAGEKILLREQLGHEEWMGEQPAAAGGHRMGK